LEFPTAHPNPADASRDPQGEQQAPNTIILKPRSSAELLPWRFEAGDDDGTGPAVDSGRLLDDIDFVALDVETTGNSPFLVLEIGAQRFDLRGPRGVFDTLVDCRAPINTYARKRHQIYREMLVGAPGFADARRAFLAFASGAVLVEHSHDAFDTFLIGRGLKRPLPHPVLDTSALARLVLGLPSGQTPGLAAVVAELGVDATPAHAALSDAEATAAVFRELVRRGRERFSWARLGDLLGVLERPAIDRSALELPRRNPPPDQAAPQRQRRRPRPRRGPDPAAVEGSATS
jgi:DNA polymerase-3 subunit epsilon